MVTVKDFLNGTPLPDWVKLLLLGASMGIILGSMGLSVSELKKNQEKQQIEFKESIDELRLDIKGFSSSQVQILVLQNLVASNQRRLDNLENEVRGYK